ncbi:MAG: hypothetical protein Q7K40_01665 [bacterium]|nr:hypothetical protein [bacterium]
MERMIPHKKLLPGVYQGTPEQFDQKKDAGPRLFRTMKMDVADAVKNQNETAVSIAIAEEKKKAVARAKEAEQKPTVASAPPAPKPIGRIIVVIIVLLVIALTGLASVYLLPKIKQINLPTISFPSFSKAEKESAVVIPIVPTLLPALIPVQYEKRFDMSMESREGILSGVAGALTEELPLGAMKNIYFSEKAGSAISSSRFFSFFGVQTPDILNRSLEKPFMVGLVGDTTGKPAPFLILKVSSYEAGLAGMLEWEAGLPAFFSTVFGSNITQTATPTAKFRDIVILEKDARLFTPAFGEPIAYAFANPNTIVIAGSRTALETLLPLKNN